MTVVEMTSIGGNDRRTVLSGASCPPSVSGDLRVAIAHDWLVKYAGAERCLDEMLEMFPSAALYTLVLDKAGVPERFHRAQPSLLQRLPGAAQKHEWFLPLMPAAWGVRRPICAVDVVLSSSYACAKAVRVAAGVPHVCYCHSPMRYAWDFAAEKQRVPTAVRPVAALAMAGMRSWDRRSSDAVDYFVANSTAVADRIKRFYGRDAEVVHPPVRTDYFTPAGNVGDEFLFVSRLVSYKRPDVVIEAFKGLPYRLNVVGDGRMRPMLERNTPTNVTFHPDVDDRSLREMYRSARAIVHPAIEDFGIVMAEAQACGTPVIAPAAGGALDIVTDGVTGWLTRDSSVAELRRAVRRAAFDDLDRGRVRLSAERFSQERFRADLFATIAKVLKAHAS